MKCQSLKSDYQDREYSADTTAFDASCCSLQTLVLVANFAKSVNPLPEIGFVNLPLHGYPRIVRGPPSGLIRSSLVGFTDILEQIGYR